MLVDDIGDVTITNDGATILKLLEVEHPAAKILVELAELLGVGTFLGVDEETAADAANALATLVSASAVGDHFEDKYYAALRDAAGRRT